MFAKFKSLKLFLSIVLLLASCSLPNKQGELELPIENWEFREAGGEWLPASVPGFVHLDLYDNNRIEDPFYRANEKESQWIATKVWEYKSIFSVAPAFLKNKNISLHFSGIDTYAAVFLNDSLIATCANFFVSHSIELASILKPINELRFVFEPTLAKANEKAAAAPYQLPAAERVQVRKPQFHFGWDWGPQLIGCGITEQVKLTASNQCKLSNVHVSTLAVNDSVANMKLSFELTHAEDANYTLSFLGEEYPIEEALNAIEFTIENPQLWTARGYGKQHFSELNLTLRNQQGNLVDAFAHSFAIRTITLVQEQDALGKGFKFQVNGKDVYAKGANWIPLDYFHTRVDSNLYRQALLDVAAANMNMLRVWGGGIYEDDYFYDLCDSLGILVWQDFMFACAMYPGNEDFLQSVEQEATQQIKRLRKHPSIALWCGNNEIAEGWHRWGWKDQRTEKEKEAIWADYQTLFNKLLPNLVRSLTTSAYWESSPQFGRGNSKHQFNGDAHYWGVWHDAEPFENFQTKVPRFMSEYGFQSFPEMEALDLFALEEDLYLESEVINTHQKHPRGADLIAEYLNRDFKTPVDFESFVYLSQIVQAEGMQMGIEAHRSARPYNMGTLYWQFNDCWPAVSWSSRDYYGNWKALHYTVKKAYEDLLVTTRQTKDSVFVYLVNDANQSMDFDLLIEHIDYTGATLGAKAKYVSSKKASSTLVYTAALEDFLYIDGLKNQSYLEVQVVQDGVVMARKLHHFAKTKDLKLPYAGISFKVEKDSLGFVVELFSDGFVKNLKLSCLHDGRFEDNYFDLPANEHKRIRFYNTYPLEVFNDTYLTFFSVVDTYE